MDSLFDRSNIVLRRVFEYTTFYQVALHKFKQGCADLGLLTEVKVSLEDCIVAVRDMVKQGMHRELTVRAHYRLILTPFLYNMFYQFMSGDEKVQFWVELQQTNHL